MKKLVLCTFILIACFTMLLSSTNLFAYSFDPNDYLASQKIEDFVVAYDSESEIDPSDYSAEVYLLATDDPDSFFIYLENTTVGSTDDIANLILTGRHLYERRS